MNDTELKVIIELLKNSRRSDRELSKAIGVSQPTVSRTIDKLKKQGYIKEFTIIPDFKKTWFSSHEHCSGQREGESHARSN